METITKLKDVTFGSLEGIGSGISAAMPKILGALAILIIGWLVSKIIIYILGKVLKVAKVDVLSDKINEMNLFGERDIPFKVSKIILGFVKWVLFLLFLVIAADVLEWDMVSKEIGNLLGYLPKLFSAVAILGIGLYIASSIKKAIQSLFDTFEFSGGKIISGLVFYVILIFVAITGINQAGIDTTIITNNITLILGAFLFAVALGFGLGSKEIISDLLRTFYVRKNYTVGDKIKMGDVKGVIEAIDNACLTLKTKNGKIIIPIKEVVATRIEID